MVRKILEEFEHDGVKLKVVKEKKIPCAGCYFNDKGISCGERRVRKAIGYCNASSRSDGQYVIFKKVG